MFTKLHKSVAVQIRLKKNDHFMLYHESATLLPCSSSIFFILRTSIIRKTNKLGYIQGVPHHIISFIA